MASRKTRRATKGNRLLKVLGILGIIYLSVVILTYVASIVFGSVMMHWYF